MLGVFDQQVDTSLSAGSRTDSLQFVPVSVTVDNPTSSWLYFPEVHKWIAPFSTGVCFPWTSANSVCEVDFNQLPTGISASFPRVVGTATVHYVNYAIPPSGGQGTQGTVIAAPKPQVIVLDKTIASGFNNILATPRGPNQSLYIIGFFYDVGNENSLWSLQDNGALTGTYWSCASNAFKSGYVPMNRLQVPNGLSLYMANTGLNSATIHFTLLFDYNQTT